MWCLCVFANEGECVEGQSSEVGGFVGHAPKYVGVEVCLDVFDELSSVKAVYAFGNVVSENDVTVVTGVVGWFAWFV